uniref:Uncharacterized protein n=1 Tax=Rhizophora mucronata TaxID=61149 RepID=A0A2P2NX58_RHIMU
MDVKRMKG